MKSFKNYYMSIIRYDLINKFNYKKLKNVPTLKKIILNFNCKSSDIKALSICSLALELISDQKSLLTQTKKSNVVLKIRKGNPVGCKITLKRQQMYFFLNKLTIEIFPKLKLIQTVLFKDKLNNAAISCTVKNLLIFSELGRNYYLFNNLTNLQIMFSTNTKTKIELIYLLNSFKLPFQ